MNILMLLSNPFTHDPRVYYEAISLIKAGHDITMLAWDNKGKNPLNEEKDGIHIVRSYNSKFMNILPYDIIRLHFWWKKGYKDALKLFEKKSFDVIHCHNLDTLPIGLKLKKKYGLKLVYDAHEIWGYMISKDLPNWWANYYLKKEKNLINNADGIITVNQPVKDYLSSLTKKPIIILMNCKPIQNKLYEPPENKKMTLLYIGRLNKSRYIIEIVEVVQEISDVKLIIGGIGKKRYVEELKEKCLQTKNVDFIGKVPPENVLPITKKADALICMFNPKNKNNQVGLPNKVFEAAVSGRPLIITKDLYYEKIAVEKGKFALSVPFSKEGIKKAIIKLKENPDLREKLGKNALKAAINDYNWEIQEKKLIKLYDGLK